jgi:hypothetical protein
MGEGMKEAKKRNKKVDKSFGIYYPMFGKIL